MQPLLERSIGLIKITRLQYMTCNSLSSQHVLRWATIRTSADTTVAAATTAAATFQLLPHRADIIYNY